MDPESKQHQEAADSIVLEEEIDPNYVPSEAEVVEYAKWLGMDLDKDNDLFWIAREGLMAPLPKNWKPCKQKDTEDIYYFNFTSGESTWDHPCDGYYKRQYEDHKKKKEKGLKESGDQNRSKAKQDVDQLLGKKKKGKESKSALDSIPPVTISGGGGAGMMERKPLPGIIMQPRLQMSSPATLSRDQSSSEKVVLSSGGDSMFTAKSKTSSKLLAAVASETADAKQGEFSQKGNEYKMEMKVDSAPLGSLRAGGGNNSESTVPTTLVQSKRPSSAPSFGGESKDSSRRDSNDDSSNRTHSGDLAPLFPRNKPLPVVSSVSSNSSSRRAESPAEDTGALSPAQSSAGSGFDSGAIRLQQLREDLHRETERCTQLEDEMRTLRNKSRDAETAATEGRRTAEAATEAIKSDVTSLEFSLRQANNYVADKNAAIDLVNAELLTRNQEIQSLSADRSGLQSQLAGLSREISRLTAELQSKSQEVTDLSRELDESRQEELRSKRTSKEKEEMVQIERDKYSRLDEALTKTISSLRQRNSDLEVSLTIASKSIDVDVKQSSPTSSSLDSIALKDAVASLAEQRALVATLKAELSSRDCAAITSNETTGSRAEMDVLSRGLSEKNATLLITKEMLNEARHEVSGLTDTADRLREELQKEVDKSQNFEANGRTISSQLNILKNEMFELSAEKASVQTRNEQLSNALETANSIIATTNSTINKNANAVEASLSAVNASLISQVSQLNARICDLEADLRESRRKGDQLSVAFKTAESAAIEGASLVADKKQIESDLISRINQLTDAQKIAADELFRVRGDYTSLQSQLDVATDSLEFERTQSQQKEKKIRSYQEELLQVQRRIAIPVEKDPTQCASAATQTDSVGDVVQIIESESSDLERSKVVITTINSALNELRSVVSIREDTIAQMSTQLQELRTQLIASKSASEFTMNEQNKQREMDAQNDVFDLKRQLDEKERAVKALTLKLQMTADQLVSAETEGNNYRSLWQEAESKLTVLRSNQQLTVRNHESQFSSAQEEIVELQTALAGARSTATHSKTEWIDSQTRLSQAQSETEHLHVVVGNLEGEVANLRKALQRAREDIAVQRNIHDAAPASVVALPTVSSSDGADKKFEATVTNSIVELSIVVGKQQASMTRLEEQLQLMSTKPIVQLLASHPNNSNSNKNNNSNKSSAWSISDGDYISSSGSDAKSTMNTRTDYATSSSRRNVKFDEQVEERDQSRERHRQLHSRGSGSSSSSGRQKHSDFERFAEESSSSDDLALLSLLRSPSVEDRIDGSVAERIEAAGRRIESLINRGSNSLDSSSWQAIIKLETAILSDADLFLSSAKAALRGRSKKVGELKALWKAQNLRGRGDGFGMSSSLINQQLKALNTAIKTSDELKNIISNRKHSFNALRDAVNEMTSHSGDTTRKRLRELRKDLSSGLCTLLLVMTRIADNAEANERDVQRERGRPRDQSFDDSFVQYDRHQVVDRYYSERAGRAAEAPEGYSRGQLFGSRDNVSVHRPSNTVASSLEFPRQQVSQTLDQRRVFAQQHIAKIEKEQTDTYKKCEDHVNFLTKMRKDLGAVSCLAGVRSKLTTFSSLSDRENVANFDCNMLLSDFDPDKKLYEI